MKIKSLLLGMMTCVALAACTNADLVENEGGNGVDNSTAKAYIGIKIATPSNNFSRAVGDINGEDGGFENGSSAEQTINNCLFLFYNADGTYAGEGKYTGKLDIESVNPSGSSVEANTTAVVILKGNQNNKDEDNKVNYPSQVVAFLNLPEGVETELKNKELKAAMQITKKASEIDFANTEKNKENFIMTNSVYLGNSDVKCATPVTEDNFAENEATALKNPITIYVERVAAKVIMTADKKLDDDKNTPNININYNSKNEYQLKLYVDGWGINGVNKNTYLLKNIDSSWNFSTWNWNDANNLRSYWAKDTNYSDGVYPENYEEYIKNKDASSLTYFSWNDINDNSKAPQYCLENTVDANIAGNINATTYMVIAGHYKLVDEQGQETEITGNLYRYIDKYYDEENLLKVLANQASVYTYTNENDKEVWSKLSPDKYKLVRASRDAAKLELKEDTSIENLYSAKNKSSKYENIEAINAALSEIGTFTTFAEGKTIFYINIAHLNGKKEEAGHIGIVRNHVYKLSLNSIKNIGEGVFDPDEEIIINEKDKEFYVSATLNILAWKVVNQDVDL